MKQQEEVPVVLLNNNQRLPKIVIEDYIFTSKSYKNVNNKQLEQSNEKK